MFTFVHMKKIDLNENRLLTPATLKKYLEENDLFFMVKTIGTSVQGRSIYSARIGTGPKKVLMWSQMHGNESTTTKSLIDFWAYLNTPEASYLLSTCTFYMIPQLNPDGSHEYTRQNANNIDLNRDTVELSQPESQLLRTVFDEFSPDYCFNLHGQRTIFSAGDTHIPATVSFLAPSADAERSITSARKDAMRLIVAANNTIQEFIPEAVGRYDDGFNINCVGDYFTSKNTPTILFEAGHYKNDYGRKVARKMIFKSIISMCEVIASDTLKSFPIDSYFDIPENYKNLRDVELYNVNTSLSSNSNLLQTFIFQFKEEKFEDHVKFIPQIDSFSKELKGLKKIDFQEHKLFKDLIFESEEDLISNLTKTISLLNFHQIP